MQSKTLYKLMLFSCFTFSTALVTTGCKKFVEPDYKTEIATDLVFGSDDNAKAAISGIYVSLFNSSTFGRDMTQYPGFCADELYYTSTLAGYDQFQQNKLLPDNFYVQNCWDNYYRIIYYCNALIENATASRGMTEAYKTQIIGEAKFVRAFCHFYLVNLFGPVPLITATSKNITALSPRSTVQEVYTQIRVDLTDAMNTLPGDYAIAGGKRIRANKWAATALMARAYLYTNDWANAEAMATAVLANSTLYSVLPKDSINYVFVNNQKESLLEWDMSAADYSTFEGKAFATDDYLIPMALVSSFDTADIRYKNWIRTVSSGNYAPYKYKIADPATADTGEDQMVLRVGEQYLIRAEARAQQNNINGAQADINVIRNRAGLANVTLSNKTVAMAAVEKERRAELFCEWGHRWFDLKRWPSHTSPNTKTRADDVLGALKTTWISTAICWPIPQKARNANPNLTQNAGY